MELVTLKITPLSSFGTFPKGDTLFGQIVAYLFLNGDDSFANYLDKEPKLIVSDMMPFGYVYKPILPLKCFKSDDNKEIDKKELRKKKFISLKNLQDGNFHLCEKIDYMDDMVSVKNSINRTTFTTSKDNFTPYGITEKAFFRELWMFILVENEIKDEVIRVIKDIGVFGFGKDGNLGKGNFEADTVEYSMNNIKSEYYMSISPTILKDNNITKSWYEPFTRFGKFGLDKAHTNAFKRPTIMADSATVVKLKNPKQYFGVSNNNGTEKKPSFLQGYSIAIPISIKDESCLNTN